jgi:hypothetical protein
MLQTLPPLRALTYPCRFLVTETFALRFSALLNEEVAEVELALA